MTDMPTDPEQPSAASIIAAAERLAGEITRNAETEADAIRARAGSDSDAARAATAERVGRLSAMADGMLERLGEMRRELDSLGASLAQARVGEPEPPVADVAEPPAAAGVAEPPAAAGVAEPPAAAGVAEPAMSDPAVPQPAVAGVDDAGARLIALNLALSNTPREEAARQLRDQVPDPERLVAEVYASVDR